MCNTTDFQSRKTFYVASFLPFEVSCLLFGGGGTYIMTCLRQRKLAINSYDIDMYSGLQSW